MYLEEINNQDKDDWVNPIVSCFFSLPPKQFALLSSLVGLILIENLNLDQQNSLGNFISSVGNFILTSAAQGDTLQSESKKNDKIRHQIEMLKKQISELEEQLD